jgi:hypothetical protein
MKTYTLDACENFISKYLNEYKGMSFQIDEGSLGLGTLVLFDGINPKTGNKLRSVVIQEFYMNAWSSGHKVRQYNKLPKKYSDAIDNA